MAITKTVLGPNTVQLTLTDETSSAGLLTALDAAIVAGGWEQHDVYNNGTQRIYRSLCKDNVAYKYFGMFFDPVGFRITTTCYETWDKINHVGTNQVATYLRTGQMHFALTGSDVILMISPRWLVLQTFIRNQPGPWAGVFECAREATEDTPEAGYPPFMWMTSILAANGYNNKYSFASFPRNRANATGIAASADGWQTQYTRLGMQTGLSGKDLVPLNTYAWDPAKKIVMSLRPTFGQVEVHGKVYGLKTVSNIGSPYSRVSLPMDADYNFAPSGTMAEHWVLAPTPAYQGASLGLSTTVLPASGTAVSAGVVSLPGGVSGRSAVFTGTHYYVAHQGGVCKIDGTTTTLNASTAISGIAGTDHRDICFDGRYVYASSPTGITRIDTANVDAVTTLALTYGTDSLFFDGTYLWAGARDGRASNSLYKINASTFTLLSTITISGVAGSNLIGGMCTDFADNLYVAMADGRIVKVVISTDTTSTLWSSPNFSVSYTQSGIAYNGDHLEYFGFNSAHQLIMHGVSTSGSALGSVAAIAYTSYTAIVSSKLQPFKVGCFNAVAHTGSGSNSKTSFSLFSGSSGSFTAAASPSPLEVVATSMYTSSGAFAYCDGGRIFAILNNAFTVLNNVMHSDDGATAMNRFLLPK